MIKTVTLTNFRQHEDLTVNMTAGLNALRGPNEAGKSTVIEAVLYALYGAKALRDTLAETVTWGKAEKDLKVSLVINVAGIDYTFTRSKGGAECRWVAGEGYLVTGQNEVTAHAADLLGADAKTASSLMLADQSGLRGALDDGPAAVSGLMSRLADFDLVDRIIETMQAKLLLGSETPIREKLAAAERELATLREQAPDEGAVVAADKALADYATYLATQQEQRDKVIAPAYSSAMEAYLVERSRHEAWDTLAQSIEKAVAAAAQATERLASAREIARQPTQLNLIPSLKAQIEDDRNYVERSRAWDKFQALPAYPDAYWEGSFESFQNELSAMNEKLSTMASSLSTMKDDYRSLERQLVTDGVCKSCGTDISKRADIVEKNALVTTQLQNLQKLIDAAQPAVDTLKGDIREMEAIIKVAVSRERLVNEISSYVERDGDFYPTRIEWKGEPFVSGDRPDVTQFKKEIERIEAHAREVSKAEGMVEVLTTNLKEALDKVEELQAQQKTVVLGDLESLQKAYSAATDALNEIDETIGNVKEEIRAKENIRNSLMHTINSYKQAMTSLEGRIVEYNEDIKKVTFNNGLLKKMRSLKPSITDHLWNTVLAAVSTFFSQLRGENSIVTKDANGFKVNGHSIDSLSGSTLDVLALAVRVALTKTFIPHNNTMVLDEPAHGCDNDRTASMLGFLSSVGFGQILVASHDELSEAVADNVITLGA